MISTGKYEAKIETIRNFNRFYVPRMGFLNRRWTSMLSLTEARIIHEIYIRPSITATDIARIVKVDAGYLSRVLQRFERDKIIVKKKVPHDARQRIITITPKGRKTYDAWGKMAEANINDVIMHMSAEEQSDMLAAMHTIARVISAADCRREKKALAVSQG